APSPAPFPYTTPFRSPEPRDRLRYSLVERRRRLPAEQLACLADVRDVVGHLAEQRARTVDLRLDVELGCNQLGRADESVALAVRSEDHTSELPSPTTP